MDIQTIVNALWKLEAQNKESPSIADIAREAKCSKETAWRYLQQAVADDLIVQTSSGRYMSKVVAAAYEILKGTIE